jgi:hypothetical protein
MSVSDQLYPPPSILAGTKPRYPLDRRLGGWQSKPGCSLGEERLPAHTVLPAASALQSDLAPNVGPTFPYFVTDNFAEV